MNRWIPIAAVLVGLFVSGCTESLAGFGGSALTTFGGGIKDSYEEKKAAIGKHKVLKDRLLMKEMVLKEGHADVLIADPDTFEEGMEELRQVIKDLDENQPEYVYEKIYKAYKERKAKTAPTKATPGQ